MRTKCDRLALLLLGLCLAAPGGASAFQHPGGLHSATQLAAAQAAIAAGEQPATAAWAYVIERADNALTEVPSAVVNFDAPGYYVDADAHNEMKYAMLEDAEAAYNAALAYAIHHGISADRRNAYADAALALMMDWAYTNIDITLSSEASGNSSTLTMSVTGTQMALAAELLWDYPGWSTQDRNQFRIWAANILRVAGIDRQTRNNNHADWGIFAALVVDHLLDDPVSMANHVTKLKEIIDDQINADGSMPQEMERGDRSLWYTYWALAPMTGAIELVRNVGLDDLYDWAPPSGGTVRQAVDFFEIGVNNVNDWPGGPQLKLPIANGWGANLLSAMAATFETPSLASFAEYPIKTSGGGSAWVKPDLLPPVRDAEEPPPTETLVSLDATWRYLDDGSDQGTAWREPAFADGSWPSGPAELGYGDGDEGTLVGSGPADAHFITTYFRHHLQVADPASVSELLVRIRHDDGAVVYLNGAEVVRSNMPDGPIGYQTPAATTLGPAIENHLNSFVVDPAVLVSGDNVLAVEVHQESGQSSDLSFALELSAVIEAPSPASFVGGLVPFDANWRYLDDGSDQGTAWREAAFADGAWSAGTAELGYGDGDESTLVASGPADSHFTTTYFRHHFEVADPAAIAELILRLRRDDGAVAYLNGVEVARSNMPDGPIDYLTAASLTMGPVIEAELDTFQVDPALLVAGDNVLAVEVHQASPLSSDLSFALELVAPPPLAAPVLLD